MKTMASGAITSWQIDREKWKQWQISFSRVPKSLQMMTVVMKLKDAFSLEEKLWQTWTELKSRDITLLTKVHTVKAMVFQIVIYGCESWTIKAEHWRTDDFELWYWRKLLSPSDCKEIKPANPKGNWAWIFIRRTDAEVLILPSPDAMSQLTGKDPDAGRIEGKRKRWWQRIKGLDGIIES